MKAETQPLLTSFNATKDKLENPFEFDNDTKWYKSRKYMAPIIFLLLLLLFCIWASVEYINGIGSSIGNISSKKEKKPIGKEYLSIDDGYTQAAIDDYITSLPGLNDTITFNHFSGYITIESDSVKNMFYWFVESTNDPDNDPVIMWTNGGPGCSGLLGLLTEQGPYWISDDQALILNPYSWNNYANMIFIEQPIGVGFSVIEDDEVHTYSDAKAAWDMDLIARGFLEKFPKYKSNDFYISAESWGGHYMPYTAKRILESNDEGNEPYINFKGFLVGNPYTDYWENTYGFMETLWGHQLLPKALHDSWKSSCYEDDTSIFSLECELLYIEAYEYVDDIDFYALDFPECVADEDDLLKTHINKARSEQINYKKTIMKKVQAQHAKNIINSPSYENLGVEMKNKIQKLSSQLLSVDSDSTIPYIACDQDDLTTYLNTEEVQTAIHTSSNNISWAKCTSLDWPDSDYLFKVETIYQTLIDDYDIKILVYSGDDDSVCGTIGTQRWIWSIGYDYDENNHWNAWKDDSGQVAGYYTKFLRSSGTTAFHFTTVRTAGHMVPTTQPLRALDVLYNFLYTYD